MIIPQMPKTERPRERLLQQGATVLSDAELLALFLRTGLPGMNAIALAHQLLTVFDSLANLVKTDCLTFCQQKGLGPAKFVLLQAAMEMAKRCLAYQLKQESVLNCPETTRHYLQNLFYHTQRELFLVLFLDNQHRVLRSETLFAGTFNRAAIHPREVVKAALTYNAAALILAHNHPSGVAEPSVADHHITRLIVQACDLIEVTVLDHFIVGHGTILSFAEQGWI
ncbi:RadC family protein [unidentified bacterial endosymbiont]|uniref:RadC family protein n=1 Tax=unidentified bacterial endosymbiont TaxID=2355 RepID=UPI0020A11F51|nr:DNA repair protein RadC [unidentified bacterial endosymbiont]